MFPIKPNQTDFYYAQETKEGGFPDISPLTKAEVKKSSDFKTHKVVILSRLLLVIALSVALSAIVLSRVGIGIGMISTRLFILIAGSAGVVGLGSGISILASKNLSRILMIGSRVLKVRWKKQDRKNKVISGEVKALAMSNSIESFQWKKKLIKNAEKRIILSGNYCGGNSFDEILDLLKKRMSEKTELKTVILSSSKFITKINEVKLNQLLADFPDRFQLVKTDDFWMDTEQGLKKITNHTKGLVVDGRHFVLGGSGIEDKYAYFEGVGDRTQDEKETNYSFFMNFLLPRGFRDMDFVFSGEEIGSQLDRELLKLGCIYETYNSQKPGKKDKQKETVVSQLLSEKITKQEQFTPIFEKSSFSGECRLVCSGPEMSNSPIGNALYQEIEKAQKHIFIDHMYFHPSKKLERLIIDKVNQGVKLTIVTNGNEEFSPGSHKVFGPRNRYQVAKIFSKVRKKNRDLIEFYEYGQKYTNTPRKTTLHKKVVVVDDTVIAGSSNLGYKSTVSSSDHEINFILKSKAVAEETIKIIQDDAFTIKREAHKNNNGEKVRNSKGEVVLKTLSRRVKNPLKYYNFKHYLLTLRHKKVAWLVG